MCVRSTTFGKESFVNARRWVSIAVAAVLLWLAVAYCAGPPGAHEYRRSAVEAAQGALTAVRSVALAGDAQERGRVFDPYFSTLIDDEAGAVASAQQQLTAQSPPDDGTRILRDQLLALLVAAAREIGDLASAASAGDRAGVHAHADRLRDLGDKLEDLVEQYQ
jgi:hypothetical protein